MTETTPMTPESELLTEERVKQMYEVLLDRPPESAAAIRYAMGFQTVRALRERMIASDEFRRKNPERLNNVTLEAPPMAHAYETSGPVFDRLLARIADQWSKLGETAPYWSVLSDPKFAGEVSEADRAAFYASGVYDLRMIEAVLKRVGRRLGDYHAALEYGCGLGRTTLALAPHFARYVGCDISEPHLAVARAAAASAGLQGVVFRKVGQGDYGMTEPFDFWYSRIVLQHNPPPLIEAILDRMFAKLTPGGIALFQTPTYALNYAFDAAGYVETETNETGVEMHCLPQARIYELAEAHNVRLLEVREDNAVDVPRYWVSNFFTFEKRR